MAVALAGCVQRQHAGDFDYDCTSGMGMFDGPFCVAPLSGEVRTGRIQLEINEGQGPWLQYQTDDGSAGLLPELNSEAPPTDMPDIPLVRSVGVGRTFIVVLSQNGGWYAVARNQKAPGMNWPLVLGPFSVDEAQRAIAPEAFPTMRTAR